MIGCKTYEQKDYLGDLLKFTSMPDSESQIAEFHRQWPWFKQFLRSRLGKSYMFDMETQSATVQGKRTDFMFFDDLQPEEKTVKPTLASQDLVIQNLLREAQNKSALISKINNENSEFKNELAGKQATINALKTRLAAMERELAHMQGVLDGLAQVARDVRDNETVSIRRGDLQKLQMTGPQNPNYQPQQQDRNWERMMRGGSINATEQQDIPWYLR